MNDFLSTLQAFQSSLEPGASVVEFVVGAASAALSALLWLQRRTSLKVLEIAALESKLAVASARRRIGLVMGAAPWPISAA